MMNLRLCPERLQARLELPELHHDLSTFAELKKIRAELHTPLARLTLCGTPSDVAAAHTEAQELLRPLAQLNADRCQVL